MVSDKPDSPISETPTSSHGHLPRSDNESPPRASHCNDPILIQRCLRGDELAWGELVERYSRLVYSIPRRSGLSQEDAEDIFQNVFVIVLRELKTLRQQDRFSAWLITVTHRETVRWIKRQSRGGPVDDVPDIPALEETLRQFEREEILRQAVDMLETRERAVIMALLSDEELSFDQLADTLHLPRGSIGYYRKRGLEHLRKNLKKLGFVESDVDLDHVLQDSSI